METNITGLSLEFIIHPGVSIKEKLEENNMNQEELAERIGFSAKHVSEVVNGKKGISPRFAKGLEYIFGIKAMFWMNLQGIYDKEILEYQEKNEITDKELQIVKMIEPILEYAIKINLMEKYNNQIEEVIAARVLCQTSNLLNIEKLLVTKTAYRTAKNINNNSYILYAWQRVCEMIAEKDSIDNEYNKDILINEIKIFLNSKVGKKYKKDLNILLENIENKDKSLEELIINNENEYERIFDLTIHNKTYIDIAKNMSALELMLLITSYIFVPFTPNIDQDGFNDLVNVAKNYDNSLENIWRLGMNYDRKGYNFDLLDNFFVDSKNVYYLGEYISLIHQINQEKIVNTIVKTKDKGFIKQILENDTIVDNLDEEYKNILKSSI